MAVAPEPSWPGCALLHSVYDQPAGQTNYPRSRSSQDRCAYLLAFIELPKQVWAHLRVKPPQERFNEIRRRTTVVGMFPSHDATVRLIGAVLAEQHGKWAESHRHPGLAVLNKLQLTTHAPPAETKSSPTTLTA